MTTEEQSTWVEAVCPMIICASAASVNMDTFTRDGDNLLYDITCINGHRFSLTHYANQETP